jgi:hypothetical protein
MIYTKNFVSRNSGVFLGDIAAFLILTCLFFGVSSSCMASVQPTQPIKPSALFSYQLNQKMPTGAKAICYVEGNCDVQGNLKITPANFCHTDYNNGVTNCGWCSSQKSSARSSFGAAHNACNEHTVKGLARAIKEMEDLGLSPSDPKNLELLINYVDAYNQSPIWVIDGSEKRRMTEFLKTRCGNARVCSTQDILDARTQACIDTVCFKGNTKLARHDQKRRVSGIYAAITGQDIVLGDPSAISSAVDVQITLIESVGNLDCWSCGIIVAVTRVADGLGNEIFEVLRGSLIALLAAILGIYLVYHAMRVLMPFGPVSSITGIFSQMTLVTGMTLLTITLLGSMAFYWDYIYRPVLSTSVGVTTSILRASGAKLETTCDYPGLPKNLVSVGDQTAAQMSCVARAINKTLSQGTRVGWAMIVAFRELRGHEAVDLRLPWTYPNMVRVVVLILSGVILMGVFIYASLAFLWVIIDIVYRWTFISLISPLAIAAYTFRETRGFSSFAIRGMMESFIGLILTAVVAAVTVKLVEQTGFDPRTTGKVLIPKNIETYIQLLEKADPAVTAPTINTTLFWSLATIGMMAGSLMFKMKELASYLTSSAIGGWATETGLKITNPGTVLNPINQIVGRFGSERMMRHLERRYEAKFEKPYVRPPKMRWI